MTDETGGTWECDVTVYEYLLMRTMQIAAGDSFRLAGGRIPFVMPIADEARRVITFGTAKEIGGSGLANVTVRYKLNRFTIEYKA